MTNGVLKDKKTENILLEVGKKLIEANIAFNCVSEYYNKLNKYEITIYIRNEYIDDLQEIADTIDLKYDIKMDINKFSISKDLTIKKSLYDII